MKLMSRIHMALSTELPLMMFFEHPTIAEQASRIEQEQLDNCDEELEDLLDELDGLPEEEQAAIVFGKQEDR